MERWREIGVGGESEHNSSPEHVADGVGGARTHARTHTRTHKSIFTDIQKHKCAMQLLQQSATHWGTHFQSVRGSSSGASARRPPANIAHTHKHTHAHTHVHTRTHMHKNTYIYILTRKHTHTPERQRVTPLQNTAHPYIHTQTNPDVSKHISTPSFIFHFPFFIFLFRVAISTR